MVEIWWRYGGDMMGKRSSTHLVLFTHMIYPTSKCPSNILINDDPLRSIVMRLDVSGQQTGSRCVGGGHRPKDLRQW